MRWGGRIAAAIEVLHEIFDRHRPASEALSDWARRIVLRVRAIVMRSALSFSTSCRKRNSFSFAMGSHAPRALVLAAVRYGWNKDASQIAEWCMESHGPGPLTDAERASLDHEPAGNAGSHSGRLS